MIMVVELSQIEITFSTEGQKTHQIIFDGISKKMHAHVVDFLARSKRNE